MADNPSVPSPPSPCIWLLLRPGSNWKASLCWPGDTRNPETGRERLARQRQRWSQRDKETQRDSYRDSERQSTGIGTEKAKVREGVPAG